MRNILNNQFKLAATVFFLMQSGLVTAEEKLISGAIGASELWDSNFFREPEAVSEKITLLTAGIGLAANVSRQQFSARWRVRSYQHAENDQFDETFQDGLVRWNGAWASEFKSNLEWSRDSYIVDRWEAPESDVVARDNAKFVLTKGQGNRFSFQVGANQATQKHSSVDRTDLNYEDNEGFAGITYQTPSSSTLTLRYRAGDRTYVNRINETPENNFDFDYRQFELENLWKISAKTSSTLTLARFIRKGIVNDSTGDSALLDFSWDATPKLQWHVGYSYRRPALGETIDMPTTIQTGFVSVSWDITSKLSLSSRVEELLRDYKNPDELYIRQETQYNLIPLSMIYLMNDSLSLKLDTAWRKNESPIVEREYKSLQAMLGITFRF